MGSEMYGSEKRWLSQASRYECVLENYFSYFSTKTYVVVLKRTFSMGLFFEHPKNMFKLMDKEIIAILGAQTILTCIWTFVSLVEYSTRSYI